MTQDTRRTELPAHTPLPWKVIHSPHGTTINYDGPDHNWCVAAVYGEVHEPTRSTRQGLKQANAKFIVTACNSHDALVGLCRKLTDQDPLTYGEDTPLPIRQVFDLFNSIRADALALLSQVEAGK